MSRIGDRLKLSQDAKSIGVATQSKLSAFHSAGTDFKQSPLSLLTILNHTNSDRYIIKVDENMKKCIYRSLLDYRMRMLMYDLHEESIPYYLSSIINECNFTIPNKRYAIYIQFDVLKLNMDERKLRDIVDFFLHLRHQIFVSPHFLGFIIIWIDELKQKRDIFDTIANRKIGIEGISSSNIENIFISNFPSNKYRNSLFYMSRLSKKNDTIYSNDIEQVCRYYGIEAARYVLHRELLYHMNTDSSVNIANDKTHYGKILYYNINSPFINKKGTLARMSLSHPSVSIKNAIINNQPPQQSWCVITQFMLGVKVQLGLQDKTEILCEKCYKPFIINHCCHIKKE